MNGTGSRHFKFYNSQVNISLYMYMKMTIAPLIKTISKRFIISLNRIQKKVIALICYPICYWGWSGGAMVLGKLPVPGRPTIWITVGQGPIALAVGGGGVVWTFLLSSILSPLSPSLWETARYRLKYCLKGPLNPKQPTNQPFAITLAL